jgi:hypothetical protein
MSKKIQISDDNGVSWSTFPGSSGSLTTDMGTIDDTIFGTDYSSMQPGMENWTMQTNGLYKGFAGYVATLKMLGTPTTMTTEPMSLVSGKTYQVTNAVKRNFDLVAALSFSDGGGVISAANIANVDFLFGRVTFVPAFTPSGGVTVTGTYAPMTNIARATGFTLTQTSATIDDTDFATAQANDGTRVYISGLKTCSLALTGIYSGSNDWRTRLGQRSRVLVEINPDGSGKSIARGFFAFTAVGQSGNVGAQEGATATLPLYVPQNANLAYPFSWVHDPSTTLNTSIQKAMTAWLNNLLYEYRYLYDGINGFQGNGIITDLSLAGGLEVMNDFTIHVQGSGVLSPAP